MGLKKAFYPTEEIELFLEAIPKGQLSGRINDLISKGLILENQMKVEQDYIRFNEMIAKEQPRKKNKKGISTTMMMSTKAFEPEDETEDFF
jgi:hypothetical protein